ncbi:Gds1 protein [Saccharomycopsis crataegensis]|uniref:Gds1 protein n=1 Tax=Saccharomycopsis crataegensis TaxID=43959 RepID=A0AAV5QKQ6_9ASCO|nr:Gds1 protein [Saccharomycopsis crataegensis]
MALANTRPVHQLPVHSPHTEFSEINLNPPSKIKLSPSQISSPKPVSSSSNIILKPIANVHSSEAKPSSESKSSPESSVHDEVDDDEEEEVVAVVAPEDSCPSTSTSPLNDDDVPPHPPSTASKKRPDADKPRKKYNINPDKQKEKKANKINVAATGISTTIPVTGERPRPEKDASLEDDVLFTIFSILYDNDAEGKGMTVKQICDVLLEKHPETAKISTKTSNLVSAKLNAYVKRVEKGEKNLKYALSREWADTSPKRMVYVYRGILTNDFYIHAIAAMKSLEENFEEKNGGISNDELSKHKSVGDKKRTVNNILFSNDKSAGNANINLGNSNHFFNNNSEGHIDLRITPLAIPYNADLIMSAESNHLNATTDSTTITPTSSNDDSTTATTNATVYESPAVSDYDFDELDSFDDEFDNGEEEEEDDDDDEDEEDEDDETEPKKRANSGSLRYPSKLIKRVKNITAAAAAPRVPKNIANSPSPSIVLAAAASLRAAALHALSPSESNPSNLADDKTTRWIQTVREGFLTQDIGTPEDISLAELDMLFN